MKARINNWNQPIGAPLPDWTPRSAPPRTTLCGRFCSVEALDVSVHAESLYLASQEDFTDQNFTYLATGPFRDYHSYREWLRAVSCESDPLFFAVIDSGMKRAVGLASYLRIDNASGVIEIGHLNFSPLLQRKPAATEAIYLMLSRVFDELGYRRCEWKCDSLNGPSRRAALRLGFTFEGIFRQALVYKGRNRDTAWYSILDHEWPAIRAGFENWLHPMNFDDFGYQRFKLADMIAQKRHAK